MSPKEFLIISPNDVASSANADDFKIAKYMKMLQHGFENDTENLTDRFRGIYGLKVKNGPDGVEGYWLINTKEGNGKVIYNGTDKPDVTFTLSDDDVVDLVSGKLNPQKAFFQGKLKIQGNVGLAMKLVDFQKEAASKITEFRSKL